MSAGLREDHDDAIPLVYGPVPDEALFEPELSESESEEEEQDDLAESKEIIKENGNVDSEMVQESYAPVLEEKRDERMASPRPVTPPLPLSPISNPSTPPRKRPRTAHWQPPPHIPNFLPPFPSDTPRHTPSPPPMVLPPPESSMITSVSPVKLERPVTPPPEVSTGAADYHTSIPYSVSSISGQPTWHLPARPASPPATQRPYELPITQSALYHAYHHVLTHPPPKDPGPANPARYKVALDLIDQTENESRWEPHSSLYAISAPNAPRVAPMGPSYPQTIDSAEKSGKDKGKETDIDARLPKKPPRSILGTERITPLISQQTSRIPALALRVLPVSPLLLLVLRGVNLRSIIGSYTHSCYESQSSSCSVKRKPEAHIRTWRKCSLEFWHRIAWCRPYPSTAQWRKKGERKGEGERHRIQGLARCEDVCNVELGPENLS